MLGALRTRSFRYLWAGQLVSQFGNVFLKVTALWLLQLRSPAYLALAGVVMMVPTVLAAFGGALVDHLGARRLMILTDVLRAAGVGLMALLVAFHPSGTPLFLLVALGLTSLGDALFMPGEAAIIPDVVDQGALPSANGLMNSSGQTAATVGYAVGGAALVALGAVTILGFDAATYALSALTVLFVTTRARPTCPEGSEAAPFSLASFREAYRVLKDLRWFFRLLPLVAAVNALLNGAFLMLPYWVHHALKDSAVVYGLLISSWTAGQILGSLSAGRWKNRPSWQVVGAMGGVEGALFAAFGLWPDPVAEGVILVLAGAANGILNALIFSVMQEMIPVEVRGRAFGLMTSFLTLANPLGPILAGLSTGLLPLAWPWVAGGAFTIWLGLSWYRSPEFRSMYLSRPSGSVNAL